MTRTEPWEEAKIRANLKAYLEAYAERDASALAALWSEKGEFQSPLSGNKVVGREAIEKEFGRDHLLATLHLHNIFRGNQDLANLVLQPINLDSAHEPFSHLSLIPRIGVNDVPLFSR